MSIPKGASDPWHYPLLSGGLANVHGATFLGRATPKLLWNSGVSAITCHQLSNIKELICWFMRFCHDLCGDRMGEDGGKHSEVGASSVDQRQRLWQELGHPFIISQGQTSCPVWRFDEFTSIPQHVFCRISRSSLICPSFQSTGGQSSEHNQPSRGVKAFIRLPHLWWTSLSLLTATPLMFFFETPKVWLCTWPVMWWNIWVSRQLRYQPMA